MGLSWAPLLEPEGSILGGLRLHFETLGSLGAAWCRLGRQKAESVDLADSSSEDRQSGAPPPKLPRCQTELDNSVSMTE